MTSHKDAIAAAYAAYSDARADRDEQAMDIALRVAYGNPVPDSLKESFRQQALKVSSLYSDWTGAMDDYLKASRARIR